MYLGTNYKYVHMQLPIYNIVLYIGVLHINALRVKCGNLENGCKWVGELGSLNAHLNTCDYALLPCENNCSYNGYVLRKGKQDHLTNHCPRRQYQCPDCEEIGEHHEMTGTHLETCSQVRVPCPNSLCTASIPRCELPLHRSTCQYESVPCKYAEVGCKEKRRRIDYKEHEENDQFHLRATTAKVLELTKKTINLETQISEQKKILSEKLVEQSARLTKVESKPQLTFRLDCFEKHKNDKIRFYSSSFHTSHKGYTFRIQVDAGGAGSGEGTHISIYACLIKGDHDDALTWPFLGEATFELLNQIEDKNHHKKTIQFKDSGLNRRVVEDEREYALGRTKFIAYTDLEYNPDKNCQYLKDDALIFRVSVRPPSYKPWLQCTHES